MSEMLLGAGVQLAFVLIDSAKDRNRRMILRKITTLFGTSGEVNVRVIVLFSIFDRTQGRVCGRKAGRLT